MRCRCSCMTANQAAERWDPRAGQSGDTQSSRGHKDIVHFVWLKCVCVCVTCRAGWLEDRSTFSHSNRSLISCSSPSAELGPVPTNHPAGQGDGACTFQTRRFGEQWLNCFASKPRCFFFPKSKCDPTFL